MYEISPAAYIAICDERRDQIKEQGGGRYDEDRRTVEDWHGLIAEQVLKFPTGDAKADTERLTKVAALAVAALESIERKGMIRVTR